MKKHHRKNDKKHSKNEKMSLNFSKRRKKVLFDGSDFLTTFWKP